MNTAPRCDADFARIAAMRRNAPHIECWFDLTTSFEYT